MVGSEIFSDFAALGIIRYIFDQGLKLPEDISIIDFTNMPINDYCRPKLTTIEYPISKIAKFSCEILSDKIDNKNLTERRKIKLKPELIIRESTGRVKV